MYVDSFQDKRGKNNIKQFFYVRMQVHKLICQCDSKWKTNVKYAPQGLFVCEVAAAIDSGAAYRAHAEQPQSEESVE